MLRRIMAIAGRDLKSGLRDYTILYILIAPFFLAILLKAFIPNAGASLIHVVVPDTADPAWVETLASFGTVERAIDREALIRRVKNSDDVFALIKNEDHVEIIAAGDEAAGSLELVRSVMNGLANQNFTLPVTMSVTDLGWRLSPLLQHGSNMILLLVSIFGGMIVMLGLVEEKQYRTLAAINVAAVSPGEYVIGKGLLGFVIPVVHGFAILLILGFSEIDYLKVTLVILSIALIGMIAGFALGVWNDNQMTAISSMKVMFLPLLGSLFGAVFLPDKWLPLLYWSPYYWAFRAVEGILLQQATWPFVLQNCGLILLISLVIYLLLQKRIRRGLV
ncbi:MAG: ABC transporter permease [Ruminococcaceae bacterium]|jgi:ABC-2 type transport system permease protein|nr:ABC transporter permease [Oscillospiraceae bacterium]